jgi:phosphate transport system substrate-binding protein
MVEGIVPIVNVPGVTPGALKLTGQVLADIFLGRIKQWNDPSVAALNASLSLPALPITIVHRADGSGSTFLMTSYLSAVSPSWKTGVGSGAQVKWPVGESARGSDAVVQRVKAIPGALGYVDAGRVKKLNLAYVALRNKAGEYPAPSGEAFAAAAVTAPWSTAPAFAVLIVDQPGPQTWPITGAVFAVMRREQAVPATALATLKFFDFALGDGAQVARDMGYVPLPVDVTRIVRAAWPRLVKTSAGVSVWPAAR